MYQTPIVHDHELCIINEVVKLMDKGFTCYLEHRIPVPNKNNRRWCVIVDILAVKGSKQVIIEVGTLHDLFETGDRISLLKHLIPDAKILHIHQWKNYGISEDKIYRAHLDWQREIEYQKYMQSGQIEKDLERMGMTLACPNKTE